MSDESGGRLDLNLLAIFDAIMCEGSLTKAGKRLGMTQSAVSHALSRLREATGGDPLFERTGRGMRPAPAGQAMCEKVREALDMLRASVRAPGAFTPERDERPFVVGLPFGFDAVVTPALARRFGDKSRIKFRIASRRAKAALAELRIGDTSLAFDYEVPETPGFRATEVINDPLVMISRRGHPQLHAGVTRELFQTLCHVGLAWNSDNSPSPITERLSALGIARRVAYHVPCFTTIPAVVETSNIVGVLPRRIARQCSRWFAVEIHDVPEGIFRLPVYMVWHESFDDDEGHMWLRRMLHEVCDAL